MRPWELRRPLLWGLVLYAAVLSVLWQRGFFHVRPPPRLVAMTRLPEAALEGTLLSGVTPKRPGDRYWLRSDEGAKVLVYLRRGDLAGPSLRPGQRVRLTGHLRGPARVVNPGDFDEAAFLDMRGACVVLHARRAEVLGPPPRSWLPWAWGESVHLAAHRWLGARFDPVRASILEGLALGYRGALPVGLEDDLQRAGVVHLLTPSADKLTMVMAAAFLLAGALRLGPLARGACAVAAGALQLLVVIPDPSHTRPWLMAAAALAARAMGREPGLLNAWLLAAWATLLWDPRQLFNAGFLLTYGALLSIIIMLPRWRPPESLPLGVRLLWAGVALEAVLMTALTPVFAACFGVISLAGFFVNLLAVPAASAAAVLVWAGWLLSALPWPLDRGSLAAAWAADALVSGLVALCRAAASLPWAAQAVPAPGPGGLLVYALGAAALFALPSRAAARRLAGAALCAAAFLGAWGRAAPPRLRLLVLDGPRAGSALAVLPDSRRLLFGAGAPPGALRAASRGAGEAVRAAGTGNLVLGDARLVFAGGTLVAALRGKEVYCVRSGPPTKEPLPCPSEAAVFTRRDGAAEVTTDGREISLVFRAGRRVHRSALP
ncbi:MAG: ComEC family competence protein [Elusimicrobia bacterium]|nr:ComEC family competence protein [Elusimicrobiota bacterium]